MPLVEISAVSFAYGRSGAPVPVLEGLDFTVEKGEMLAIQGPSGSGKSTLLYLVGCLLKPDSGRVVVGGEDLGRLSNEHLAELRNRRIGFVFQQFHLLARATVLENILLPTTYPCETATALREGDRKRAAELARSLGIDSRLHHLPNQLSGGQQQRVAIARALMRDPELILADEPTGNLDSKSSSQILDVLQELNRAGKTVIIITHDAEVAARCTRVLHIRDGKIVSQESRDATPASARPATQAIDAPLKMSGRHFQRHVQRSIQMTRSLLPLAFENIRRNKGRSLLTMLGIVIGIASVLAMVTLGQFTKRKILDSFAELGVNTILFHGYPNWKMRATDRTAVMFRFFDWQKDITPLATIFPEIEAMSPALMSWGLTVTYGGKTIEDDPRAVGVSPASFKIAQRDLLVGQPFNQFHLERKDAVCVIGYEIAQKLFSNVLPVGQVLHLNTDSGSSGCRIIGVLKSRKSNNEWMKPNLHVILPYTYFQAAVGNWWESQIRSVMIQMRSGADIEQVGNGIRAYFEKRYGKSGEFRVDADTLLVSQMEKFLTLFTILLGSIAMISLTVGGIGIMNMMLASVNERYREIGLRKALGATDLSVRLQLLLESVVLCASAGFVGVLLGAVTYQTLIFAASRFVKKVPFEWVVDPIAFLVSAVSILAVGIASGIVPALKAERLQVIEALRSE